MSSRAAGGPDRGSDVYRSYGMCWQGPEIGPIVSSDCAVKENPARCLPMR